MEKIYLGARLLLGLIFTLFGLNGFIGFLPTPEVSQEAGAFLMALGATGYMFPVIKAVEVLTGLMFLSNKFVSLGLLLSAPIVLNIALFHYILDPAGWVMTTAIVVLFALITKSRWASFTSILKQDA